MSKEPPRSWWRALLFLGLIAALIISAALVETHRHAPTSTPATKAAHMNRLASESSPYLLQHADNPVDWYPWGEEAIERARKENKPLLVSIGYSTCYWCHVMEDKVFTNESIAKLMNDWFINIKIDREERPDLDDLYMTAAQVMTGGGGWPLNIFLTPDLKPFYAGTYFPPEDTGGHPGFPTLLTNLHHAWVNKRADIDKTAAAVQQALDDMAHGAGAQKAVGTLDPALLTRGTRDLSSQYDARYGGFGGAPKFPTPVRLEFLLAEFRRTGDTHLLTMVTETLDQMARGGMYDQLGAGFHRYSTDQRWLVPHFEKMLYDNALLARVYIEAFRLTKNPEFERVAREIYGFVQREMTDADGGFYSALDASTDHEEGQFYTWTEKEIDDALGADAKFFKAVFGIDGAPNFATESGEKKYVLYLPRPIAQLAREQDVTVEQFWYRVNTLRRRLLDAREHRTRPRLDDKVLADWNGLMIDSYAYAALVTGDLQYRGAAERAAHFVLETMDTNGDLAHMYRQRALKEHGMLDDYAFLADGLLTLHQLTGEDRWLRAARDLVDRMVPRFWDEKGGGFFATTADQPYLLVRMKPSYDGATPSGNAVAAWDLVRLARVTGDASYADRARRTIAAFAGHAKDTAPAFTFLLTAYSELLNEKSGLAALTPAAATLTATPLVPKPAGAAMPKPNTGAAPVPVPAPTRPATSGAPTNGIPTQPSAQSAGVGVTVSNGPMGGPPDLMTMTATARPAGNTIAIEVKLQIKSGWHVNANPASDPLLIATALSVTGDGATLGKVTYPPGRSVKFTFSDTKLLVYEGTTTLTATVKLANPSARPRLAVELRYQACNDKACLAPTTLDATLNLSGN